jgi:hypothetical protein
MFDFGDIVKPKFSFGGVEYYIVTDVNDFSKSNDGSDMQYEIMRIFPISKASRVDNLDDKRLELVAKGGTKDARLVLDFVMKKRAEKGWNDTPDFETVMYHNMKLVNGVRVLSDPLDVVRYDQLGSIDECLDAMNDLQEMYNVFGDEAYLQLREVVQNRLRDLI